MKYNCDIISDLLPLYIDNACTSSSAQAVEEHLAECSVCTKLYEDMKNSENVLDSEIKKERDEVLTKQSKYFKRRSVLAGSIIGGIFSIPILVCLIVNLASGAGLSWFFIVLTAMFIPASLTVVPLMIPQNKALCTLGAFTASLLTLLGVCCIYSGGSWFAVAASSVVFGLTIVFLIFDGVMGDPVQITLAILYVIPLFLLLFLGTFAVSLFIMHFGVFIEDLNNVITVVLQLGFYVSGIFYSLENRLEAAGLGWAGDLLTNCNPVALIMADMRAVVLGNGEVHLVAFFAWLAVSVITAVFGIRLIYRFENSYVKII